MTDLAREPERSEGGPGLAGERSEPESVQMPGLDGLRGLAAAVVVVGHSFNAVAMPMSLRRQVMASPLALLLNGEAAVQIFFVLSGWVLAASLSRSRGWLSWVQFWVKRVFRIHPPYVFGVLFAWCAVFWMLPIERGHGLTQWLDKMVAVHLAPGDLLASFAFPGTARGQLLIGWTLEVEMIFSLLLPLLVVAARPLHGAALLLGALALLLLPAWYAWYTLDFALGVVAFQERAWLSRSLAGSSGITAFALVVLAAALLCAPFWLGWSTPIGGVLVGGFAAREIAVMSPGAVLAVACAAWQPSVRGALSRRPVRFLGRISYSLYLVHLPVLALVAPRLVSGPGAGQAPLLIAVVFASSALLAGIAYRWIERPSIELGNRICRRLAARFGTEALVSHAGGVR